MKKKEIIGEGHCGLTIELNLMDQYAITQAIERMEEHNRILAEHDAWVEKKNNAHFHSFEEKEDWLKQNPEPMLDTWSWPDEMLPIYTFLKKLILPKCAKATVFDKEDASPIKQ